MVEVNYRKYHFYKNAHKLTLEIYNLTKNFPKEEKYGLSQQLRRASVSITSNIAEGAGRSTIKDFKNFLHMALGSAKEVECQLLLAKDLGYMSLDTYTMLNKLLGGVIGPIAVYIKKINENKT